MMQIRESQTADWNAIEALYPAAFPDEDLVPVVRSLEEAHEGVLALVAIEDSQLVGHIAFSVCTVDGMEQRVSLLAPLAVAPGWQKQGVGSALVRDGLERLRDAGFAAVYVLGDPAYYGRFGFKPRATVQPPHPVPDEWIDAWQWLSLSDEAPPPQGKLLAPPPWNDPALWSA